MVNNRSTLELLKIVLDNVNTVESISIGGLCPLLEELYLDDFISTDELDILSIHMGDNKPVDKSWCDYWWPKYEVKPRKEWLENQIKLLENTSNHDN